MTDEEELYTEELYTEELHTEELHADENHTNYFKKAWKDAKRTVYLYTKKDVRDGIKDIWFAVVNGIVIGGISTAFAWGLQCVTALRQTFPWLLYFLPLGGIVIVALYHFFSRDRDPGTNILLSTVHGQSEDVPAALAPLIFISSMITHLFGGSAGREGAALQIGGSVANTLANLFQLNDKDKKIVVMSGMSAAFSAVFGTPLAAAIFPMEMISVGIMHYSALVPCVFAAVTANILATSAGIAAESFAIQSVPILDPISAAKITLLGFACALVSVCFCQILRTAGGTYNKYIKNPYVKVVVGGIVMIAFVKLLGTTAYCGAGMNLVEEAIAGEVNHTAFIWKMLLTAVTLAAGYKGGEIVPAFATGAAFGCMFGFYLGISPSMCAAIGMISVFCGVTNCPITSLMIGFELFGFQPALYFLIAVSISYLFSGYRGLYKEQIIVYSKFSPMYINKTSGDDNFSGADYE